MVDVVYDIPDPNTVTLKERTPFIQAVCGAYTPDEQPLEDLLVKGITAGSIKATPETLKLAKTFIEWRDRGARLPKFSRWALGMFKDDKELAKAMAAAGKLEEQGGEIKISYDKIDILRCADTPHFRSCFAWEGGHGLYKNLPRQIAEQCEGIAIAYVDDDKGKMRGRVWVHHAKDVNNSDVVVVCKEWAGSLSARQVVDWLRKRGLTAYVGGSYGSQADGPNAVPVNFVGCFTEAVHHDMYTWVRDYRVPRD